MSDAKTARTITIANSDDFRKIAAEFGVTVGKRGGLPAKRLASVLLDAERKGEVKVIDTDCFSLLTAVFGAPRGEKKIKPDVSFTITYKMVNNGEPAGEELTLSLTEDEVRSYLPHVKGMVSAAYATMVLALHLADDDEVTPITALLKYAVSDVERVETSPVVAAPEKDAETTEQAPKGDDTSKEDKDADKPSETVEESTPVVSVPVEAPKPAPRTRKAKAAASKDKELTNA